MGQARLIVALSGGVDSSALLHAIAMVRGTADFKLRAMHVNHGLHPHANDWSAHCARLCQALDVQFVSRVVEVARAGDSGLEAAARLARYDALRDEMFSGEILLTGHQLDDQAETILLRLVRGAGPRGLAGIPGRAEFGPGRVVRPLLAVSRAELAAYVRRFALIVIEDPTNAEECFDRNLIRLQILPALRKRWPGAVATITRAGRLQADAAKLIDALAVIDARRTVRRGRISVEMLRQLDVERRHNLVRRQCRARFGTVPAEIHLARGLENLLTARADRNPVFRWPGGEIRRFGGELHFILQPRFDSFRDGRVLRVRRPVDLGSDAGRLRLVAASGAGLSDSVVDVGLRVGARRGGERIRLQGAGHSRSLKKLLQERGVFPWMRDRVPLLYAGDELVAVADMWIADGYAALPGSTGYRVRWEGHQPIA